MKKPIFLISLVLICGLNTWAAEPNTKLFYAADESTEAIVQFSTQFEIRSLSKPSAATARNEVDNHITYLFGPLSAAQVPAVPKEDQKLTNIKITKKPQTKTSYIISYNYEGTFVVGNGVEGTLQLTLPTQPHSIYRRGLVKVRNKITYPCTDDHYNSEDDFWYFWNPEQEGCPLVEDRDYNRIAAKLTRKPNTRLSYPEYSRLVDKEGNISIFVLIGMDDEEANSWDAGTSQDYNALTYRKLAKTLKNLDFTSKQLSEAEVQEFLGVSTPKKPTIEVFSSQRKNANVTVTLFFGSSDIEDSNSSAFHYAYKRAIETGSVMIYNGHSGLGGHLDIESVESSENFSIQFPKDRYQIYFFDSCSSYPYYNTGYFSKKGGTHNLDILTHGLATDFSDGPAFDATIMTAVINWADGQTPLSYQDIAKKIGNSSLFGVNGDEDNPQP